MGLAMVTVPLTLLAVAVTARRIGFPLLAGVFAVTQLGLHVAFEALTAPVMGVTTAGMPGAHHAGHLALTGAPPAVDPMGGVPAWMLIAHLVAALACALVLARGEQALWALVAWLAPALHAAVAAPVPVVHGLVAPTARVPGVLLRHLGRPAARPREAGLPGGPDLLRRLGRHLGRPGRRGATRARAPRPAFTVTAAKAVDPAVATAEPVPGTGSTDPLSRWLAGGALLGALTALAFSVTRRRPGSA